jgi:acetyl esterase/lipase
MAHHPLGRRDVLSLAALATLGSVSSAQRTSRASIPRQTDSRRRQLYGLLGDLPDRRRPIAGRKREQQERDGYVLETWELDLNGIEPVPAYLARPQALKGRTPAVLFNHSHGGGYKIGKQEFIEGRSYLQPVPYAKVLTDLGYAGLCIDHWVFGERSHTTEQDMFKAMLWHGQVLWGMMVYDSVRALDWLIERPDVDRARIGTLGISMGSTMAWWLAALDERVKVTVDICCLTTSTPWWRRRDSPVTASTTTCRGS